MIHYHIISVIYQVIPFQELIAIFGQNKYGTS